MERLTIVDFEDVDIAEDGSGELLLDGLPFSGIAYERDEADRLISVGGALRGFKHAVWREWRPGGDLRVEHYYFAGSLHGPWREWDRHARLVVDEYWECGELVYQRHYDARQAVTKRLDLDPDSPAAARIQRARSRLEWRVVDIVVHADVERWGFVEHPSGWRRPDRAGPTTP